MSDNHADAGKEFTAPDALAHTGAACIIDYSKDSAAIHPDQHGSTDKVICTADSKASSCSSGSLQQLSDNVVVDIESSRTIYDLWSRKSRWLILTGVSLAALLVPLTDTIYLPALAAIGQDLQASDAAVAATVSVFLFTVSIGNLLWGPVSDRYGRRWAYNLSTVLYLGTTLGCIFSPSIEVLIAMRALQGLAQCSFMTTGQAVAADVFPPAARGAAMGWFILSVLFGMVIAPLIGGPLSQAFGWRSTFIFLAIFCGGVGAAIFFLLPETNHYKVLKKLSKCYSRQADALAQSGDVAGDKPVLQNPLKLLKYFYNPKIAPYMLLNAWTVAVVFAVLTEWSIFMAQPPYNLSPVMIGVTYIAYGFAAFAGSPVGGWLSDKSAVSYPSDPRGRMVFNLIPAAIFMPAGLLLYGWGLSNKLYLGVLIVANLLVGIGDAAHGPGVFSYVSVIEQANAGAAIAAINAGWTVMSAIIVLISVPGVKILGVGQYFTLLAAIQFLAALLAAWCIYAGFRATRSKQSQNIEP